MYKINMFNNINQQKSLSESNQRGFSVNKNQLKLNKTEELSF